MKRDPLDRCAKCGRDVQWARIGLNGHLRAFELTSSPALAAVATDEALRREFERWALAPATPGHYPEARDLTRGHPHPIYGESLALPHDAVCKPRTRATAPKRRRRLTPALAG